MWYSAFSFRSPSSRAALIRAAMSVLAGPSRRSISERSSSRPCAVIGSDPAIAPSIPIRVRTRPAAGIGTGEPIEGGSGGQGPRTVDQGRQAVRGPAGAGREQGEGRADRQREGGRRGRQPKRRGGRELRGPDGGGAARARR